MILLASTVEIPFMTEIIVILGLSILVIFLFQKFNMPAVLGFLATGILFGPHAFGLVDQGTEIETMSEIGVILLLFIIGLEFSFKHLLSMRKIVLIGGGLQVLLTILFVGALSLLMGFELNTSVFIGFLFALSSTAIVLKILQDKGLMRTTQGRIALGILIFQDVIVVPMMLLTPILAGIDTNVFAALFILALKVILVIGLVYVSARHLVPRLLHEIARTHSRELFLITIIVICFSVAYITSLMGLSLALGAFMAGLCISESEYSHQATGLIIPFREIFTSFFFVSIGMLLDIGFLLDHITLILLMTIAVILIKFLVLISATTALRYPLKTGILVGLSLFQVGEFAFILSRVGIEHGLLSEETNQYFLSVSILTMAITPFLIDYGDKLAQKLLKTPFRKLDFMQSVRKTRVSPLEEDLEDINSHLIIIGYGTNGKNAARTAAKAGIPYLILEYDADVVQGAKNRGEPIFFGDARSPHILEYAQIHRARVVIVAVTEYDDALKIVSTIRKLNHGVHIIVRARSIEKSENLLKEGASEAISEEFESSVEVFARMLHQFLVSNAEIDAYIEAIRNETYSAIHSNFHIYQRPTLNIGDLAAESIHVRENSPVNGKHLYELEMTESFQVRLVAIIRKGKTIHRINADTRIEAGDELILAGGHEHLKAFLKFLSENYAYA